MGNLKELELVSFLNKMIKDLSLAIDENEKNGAYDLARDNRNKRIAYMTVLSFVRKGGIE